VQLYYRIPSISSNDQFLEVEFDRKVSGVDGTEESGSWTEIEVEESGMYLVVVGFAHQSIDALAYSITTFVNAESQYRMKAQSTPPPAYFQGSVSEYEWLEAGDLIKVKVYSQLGDGVWGELKLALIKLT